MGFSADTEQKLWVNRIDDLQEVFGLTIPAIFGVREEENAGIIFDWNYVKAWGFFYGDSYTESEPIYYTGGADSYLDDLSSRLQSVAEAFLQSVTNLFELSPDPPAVVIPHHARLTVEDIHYIKQLVVTSHDTPGENPHFKIEQDTNETDYNNAKLTASSLAAKYALFRPIKHMYSDLDVRLHKGMRFQTSDGKEWSVISVKQIINDDGDKMEIEATPRLVL